MRLVEMIYTEEDMQELRNKIIELEEENKALKITVDEDNILAKDYVELKEENWFLRWELSKVVGENLKLKEEIQQWLNAVWNK